MQEVGRSVERLTLFYQHVNDVDESGEAGEWEERGECFCKTKEI